MAKQCGLIQLTGTMGNINFYQSPYGNLARTKPGVDRKRYFKDKAFERSWENNAEFGRASNGGKLLRRAFYPYVKTVTNAFLNNRLTSSMYKMIRKDPVNVRGKRMILNATSDLLTGFEFNPKSSFRDCCNALYTIKADRDKGEIKVEIPSFNPMLCIAAPEKATHFKIISGAATIDFEKDDCRSQLNESVIISLASTITNEIRLTHLVLPQTQLPLFMVMGIVFYQDDDGDMYEMRNRAFNALKVVRVEK
jgi:hypothetical protein